MYEDLHSQLSSAGIFSETSPLSTEEVEGIRARHPDIPVEYLAFLSEIGWGELRGRSLMLYSGLLQPSEIFDNYTAAGLSGLLFLGDDMAGYCFAFDPRRDWSIVGVDSATRDIAFEAQDFKHFIRDLVKAS